MKISNIIKKLKQIPNQNAKTYCRDDSGSCYEVYRIDVVDGKPCLSIRRQEEK